MKTRRRYNKISIIPIQYQQVEYIDGTKAYIVDTDIEILKEGRHFATMAFKIQNSMLYTNNNNGTKEKFGFQYYKSYDNRWLLMGTSYGIAFSLEMPLSQIFKSEYYIQDGISYLIIKDINGQILNSGSGQVPVQYGTYSLFGKSTSAQCGAVLYETFIILDVNNRKYAEFVPCYRKVDGKAGVYESVRKVFYPIEGTVIVGLDVN